MAGNKTKNFWDRIADWIDSIKIPIISDKPKTPSNKQKLNKWAKDVAKDINKISDSISDSAIMNADMCKRLEPLVGLATVPAGTLQGLIDYTLGVVNFFRTQYDSIIQEQIILIDNVQKVVTALNNKVAEINDFCCSNEEFEFPQINPISISLGCSLSVPSISVTGDLVDVASPSSLTLDPMTCEVPPVDPEA